jgi:SAM-dependent methyltransferase
MDDRLMRAMLEVDDDHWWYRGRRAVIAAELEQLAAPAEAQILDAGCGSGATLVELTRWGSVSGIDLNEDAADVARSRGAFDVRTGKLEELPWKDDTFDLVTCLDVIEHTADDVIALRELHRVVKAGGWSLITVPAYQALWSRHDETNHHFRRYSRRSLREAARVAGWQVQRETSFNTLLLAPAAAVRLAHRGRAADRDHTPDLHLGPKWLNGLLELPMRAEARWLGAGHSLPAGLSLLVVLRKPPVHDNDGGRPA